MPPARVNKSRRWARGLEPVRPSTRPGAGRVTITCDDPPMAVTALVGESSPRISGGVGGWESVARPHQTAMTVWNGVEPFELELELVLDRFATGTSIEVLLRRLTAVAGGDPEVEPGVVQVLGIPSLPADRWVISELELGDGAIRRSSDFARVRQPITVTLLEYVPPTYLRLRRRALQGTRGKTKVVTVKHGDTPARIARRLHCKWTAIRELNPGVVRKANQNLRDGSKIRVPVAHSRDRKAKGHRHPHRKGHG
jgi:hypothetical protein